ncbi:MAG: hypothetical protein ACRC1X_09185 [Lactobacillus panisapium]
MYGKIIRLQCFNGKFITIRPVSLYDRRVLTELLTKMDARLIELNKENQGYRTLPELLTEDIVLADLVSLLRELVGLSDELVLVGQIAELVFSKEAALIQQNYGPLSKELTGEKGLSDEEIIALLWKTEQSLTSAIHIAKSLPIAEVTKLMELRADLEKVDATDDKEMAKVLSKYEAYMQNQFDVE